MDLLFTSIFIGIGLAMDCLAVSFAVGAHEKTSRFNAALILAFFFGGFQAGMTVLGWFLGSRFADAISAYDHWIAALLLFVIGAKMFFDGIKGEQKEDSIDIFNVVAVLVLAIATSIDALAVGLSFALLHIAPLIPAGIIGLISGIFSVGGVYSGGKAGHLFGKRIDLLGGFIVIIIGVRIILEHVLWNGNGV